MISLERCTSAQLSQATVDDLRALLWSVFAGSFSQHDFEHCFGGEHVLVRDDDALVAHAAVIPRTIFVGDRELLVGYVEGVATRTSRQGERLGSRAMQLLATIVAERYQLGALSTSRHSFYERLGWQRWRGPSWVMRDGHRMRTKDEDDGLMVLRLAAGADLDLTSSIACHDRPGDAW